MTLFRRMKAALYRWRLARIDRRLDALQARRRGQTERTDVRRLGMQFDALAIDRAVMARRLGRLSDGALPPPARRPRGTPADPAALERYLRVDEELGAARAGAADEGSIDRLTQELAAAQREVEAGRARRRP
jgi:hypothetical protein